MVVRRRLRAFLNTLALYAVAALLITYFAINAYTGNHGLRARHDLEKETAQLEAELAGLKTERRNWEGKISLLLPVSIDADLLDERARALLNYVDPRDVTLLDRR